MKLFLSPKTNSSLCRPIVRPVIVVCLMHMAFASSSALAAPGDMNCDGTINVADIPLFVDALLPSGGFGGCDINRADMNWDAIVNGRDIQAFVAALLNPCQGGSTNCFGTCTNTAFDPLNCGGCGIVCDEPGKECCSGGVCQSCW